MTSRYLSEQMLQQVLAEHQGESTLAPIGASLPIRPPASGAAQACWLGGVDPADTLVSLRKPRASQSFKGVLLPPAESLGRYGSGRGQERPAGGAVQVAASPTVVVGVRACELTARSYLDKVLLEGAFRDEGYARRRTETVVVSCDCVDCAETCCCTLVGGRPFAEECFDVNLTPIEGGFVVDCATDRGREWIGADRLTEATGEQLAHRARGREQMTRRVTEQNGRFTCGVAADPSRPAALPDEEGLSWQQFAADCVECGACTNICPTCHCFYLYDHPADDEAAAVATGEPPPAGGSFERVRTWDSCLLSTYHRMAGVAGAKLSPRPRLRSRLANRVLHKFAYSPQQYGMLGCVGCGRCIDACLGAIDIREVVSTLEGQDT